MNPKISIVLIDNIRDFCYDFNSSAESLEISRWIKRILDDYNVLIIYVLHVGKKDRMSLGHLGSELDRLSRGVYLVDKDQQTKKFFTLSCEYQRECGHFDPITVTYDSGGVLVGVQLNPKTKSDADRNPYEVPDLEHNYMIDQVLGTELVEWDLVVKNLMELKGLTKKKATEYVKMWRAKQWIYRTPTDSRYKADPNSKLNKGAKLFIK
jgi:hypothetical protein